MGFSFRVVADIITMLGGLLAFLVLGFAILRSATGEAAIGDYVLACSLVVVPYCFAGALHRMKQANRG